MLVGLLADLGVAPSAFEWELSRLGLEDHHLHFERVSRAGISSICFSVHGGATHQEMGDESSLKRRSHPPHDGDHFHQHQEEPTKEGRNYRAIRELINRSELSAFVKEKSIAVFQRLATVEGKIHGVPADDVHFHEVGALDSIVDIVLTCVGLETLRISEVRVSPLVDGQGVLRCAHGEYPVPAPATLELLTGLPLRQIPVEGELITPTGAALLAEFQKGIGPMPALRIEKIGYGAGSRELPGRANVLRGVLGELERKSGTDEVVEIQANIDDLSPEILGSTQEQLFASGALDVFFTPVQMKKNRPGTLLTVLCHVDNVADLETLIFRETSTFGIRRREVQRRILDRQILAVETAYGPVRVKLGLLGDEVVQVSPEFGDCRARATEKGAPLKRVYEAAMGAFRAQQERMGDDQ